ncbi:MAG: hypothetical protein K2J70_05465, partial [Muribaculaceae bacterium]|nr:hypothetical protein [Muribaculaceae bacterium]
MKRFLTWFSMILGIPTALYALEPYRDGTQWITSEVGTHEPGLPCKTVVYTLSSREDDNDPDYFEISTKYEDSQKEDCGGYIRKEREKVYYKETNDTDEWRLLYDFGLNPGDTAEIWGLGKWERLMKCVDIKPDPSNPGLEIMEMEVYSKAIPGSESQLCGTGQWIRGISSTNGLIFNVFGVDGLSSRLEKVVNGHEIIWQAPASAVKTVFEDKTIPVITSEKGTIRIFGV